MKHRELKNSNPKVIRLPGVWLSIGGRRYWGSAPGRTFGFIVAPAKPEPRRPWRGYPRVDAYVSMRGCGLRVGFGAREWDVFGSPDYV
jgi:hypothetical protein